MVRCGISNYDTNDAQLLDVAAVYRCPCLKKFILFVRF